jgi:hypothetical protein
LGLHKQNEGIICGDPVKEREKGREREGNLRKEGKGETGFLKERAPRVSLYVLEYKERDIQTKKQKPWVKFKILSLYLYDKLKEKSRTSLSFM